MVLKLSSAVFKPTRKGSKTKRMVNGKILKLDLNDKIKKVVTNMHEAHHKYTNISPTIQVDWIATQNVCGNIPQGDTAETRSGDRIMLEAIKFRAYLSSNYQASVTCRLLLIKLDMDFGENTDTFSNESVLNAPTRAEIFQPNIQNVITGNINARNCTVLFDRTYRIPEQNQSGQIRSLPIRGTVKLKQKFQYKRNSNYGKFKNIYWIAMAQAEGAAQGITNLVTWNWNTDLIYKDLD